MKFRPLQDRVLIRRIEEEEKTRRRHYRNEPVELHQYIGAILNWSRKGLLPERSVQDLILDRGDTMRGSSYKSGASGWHRQRT